MSDFLVSGKFFLHLECALGICPGCNQTGAFAQERMAIRAWKKHFFFAFAVFSRAFQSHERKTPKTALTSPTEQSMLWGPVAKDRFGS
ncbi:hypothetical protein EUGRSUZ_E01141 [Eucalyptus grandis]|uniref:Uncharacterized protein n=2 Tax=Eucalyptus grandis TaxID=71139 RepID=A0ACC3KVS9_EUCGR|nr:hypothetical protein EUGRSUZ_E01141 [Eucalyptus grandis]